MEKNNMLSIDKKYKKEITTFQKEIKKQNLQQDKKFEKICKKLDIDADGDMGNCLFDYIYNDCNYCVEFTDDKKPNQRIY
jgi:hypothetical protein